MKITFVRHGETDWNKAGRIMGQTDLPLNETGLKQAEEIAQELKGEFDVIFTSSKKRALQTASRIKERLTIPIVVSDLIFNDWKEYKNGSTLVVRLHFGTRFWFS